MSVGDEHQAVRLVFEFARARLAAVAADLTDDPDTTIDEAEGRFDAMVPELAYVDDPGHPMATQLFLCAATLALYLALRERGVDVHDFGRAIVENLENDPVEDPDPHEDLPAFFAAAEASQTAAAPGEFVFEGLPGGDDFEWGFDVTTCGIVSLYSRYGATDLVPYMCAIDDVMSDQANAGLRRSGTVALGADRCDFRYQAGGIALPVAVRHPDSIRIRPASAN